VARAARTNDRGLVRCALVLVAACSVSPPPDTDSYPNARPLQLDITVGHDGVWVYTSASDTDCKRPEQVFPQPGQASVWGDTSCASYSCLDHLVLETPTGRELVSPGTREPNGFATDVTDTADAILEIEGCYGFARIPLGALSPPHPTVMASVTADGHRMDVSWSGTPAARTALAWFSFGLWMDLQHVTSTQFEFTPSFSADAQYATGVRIETFAGVEPIATPYGIARLWVGDTTFLPASQIPGSARQ